MAEVGPPTYQGQPAHGAPLEVWVRRVAPEEMPVPESPQQTDATCGPAALRSALAYYFPGETPPEELLAEMAGTTRDGTSPESLAETARQMGLDADVKERMTPLDVADHLAAGRLVVLGVQAWAEEPPAGGYGRTWDHGHYVLAVGFDGERFSFVDPALEGGRATLTVDELLARWRVADVRGRWGLGVVLSGPTPNPLPGGPAARLERRMG